MTGRDTTLTLIQWCHFEPNSGRKMLFFFFNMKRDSLVLKHRFPGTR